MRTLIVLGLLVLLSGCSDTARLDALVEDIERLRAENRSLQEQQESLARAQKEGDRSAEVEKTFASIRADWSVFQKSYSPEQEAIFRKNLDAVDSALKQVAQLIEAAKGQQAELHALVADTKRLRDLTAAHESEAKRSDLVAKLAADLESLKGDLGKVKRDVAAPSPSITRLQSDLQSIRSSLTMTNSTATRAETLARQALAKPR